MKGFLLSIIASLLFQSTAFTQPKVFLINDSLLGIGNLWGIKSIYLSADHSIVTAGNSFNRILLTKTDEFGNLVWSKLISTENNNVDLSGRDMISTLDGGFLITGSSAIPNQYANNAEILKLDNNGNLEWGKEIDGGHVDAGYSAVQLDDSSYIISGETVEPSTLFDYSLLMKIDPSGNIVWMKTLNDGQAVKVIKTIDGYATISQYNLFKFDSIDSLTAVIAIRVSPTSSLTDFIQTSNHDYVFVGVIINLSGRTDIFILRTDSVFQPLWHKTMDISHYEGISSVLELSNGDLFFCADTNYFYNPVNNEFAAFAFELDGSGNYKWGKILADSTKVDNAIELPGREILLTGNTKAFGFPLNGLKLFLIEIDSSGLGCLNDIPFGNVDSDSIVVVFNNTLNYFSLDTLQSWNDGSIVPGNTTLSLICGNFPNQVENIFDSKASVSFYPNPTTGKIYIEAGSHIQEIELRTVSGELVLKQTLHPETTDLSFLKPGIYFLKIVLEGGEVGYTKVLLN